MTPAELLAAAADRLDKLTKYTTHGPWAVYGDGQSMMAAVCGGSEMEFGVVEDREISVDDAHYIAAMNPLVGKALAKHMRHEAEWSERYALNGLRFDGQPGLLEIARLIVGGA